MPKNTVPAFRSMGLQRTWTYSIRDWIKLLLPTTLPPFLKLSLMYLPFTLKTIFTA